LVAALVPLTDAVVIAKYNEGLETAKKTGFEASKAAGNLNLSDFKTLSDMAAETVTRAKKKLDFDNGLTASALASKTLIDGKVTANATAITKNAADITAHAKKLAAAIATCKGVGYDKAQNAMKDFLAKQKADDAKAATVKSAYETKAAFATTGETNTECSFPVVTAGEAAKPRPKCKEGYCCGSAQKFMRDGTKIAVETCQKNKGVSTYTYYPPLPAKAIAEPTPETWRFQCISGAKQLVATATAALAATYMMA
jgi:predicted secreted protein